MRISHIKEKLLFTAVYAVLVAVLSAANVPCLFRYALHIPCPGCGMTHALLSALQLDFTAAFSHHPMFWSVPVLYAYFLLDNGLFRKRGWNALLLCGIGVGFLIHWLWSVWQIFC